ncbi:MAG: Ig-like domain-containing protein, partial [Clostridiales Family XIII bacterium]|nr:Ig-like domain-containing protein [Clostridiales Family XIII bacterium]
TATTLNGKKTTVKIKLSPTAVKLTKAAFSKKSLSLKKGKTAVLELKLTPKNATNLGQVKFTSSNKKVATVDEAGKVTAVKKGKATITAKVGGKTAKIVVTVK